MILTKNYEHFIKEYDFIDSIVTEIKWDSNLLDLLVVVDYYWDKQVGRTENRDLTLHFKNCSEAAFKMPKFFDITLKEKLPSYVYSWYTITHVFVYKKGNMLDVSIKTIDNDPKWLSLICEEIWIEGKP